MEVGLPCNAVRMVFGWAVAVAVFLVSDSNRGLAAGVRMTVPIRLRYLSLLAL